MAVSRLRQDQLHTEGSAIDDTLTPTNHDANAVDLADTVSYMASQLADITGETAWETAPDLSIAAIVAKTFLDEKLACRELQLLTDVTVPNGQNFKILSVAGSELPAGGLNRKCIAGTSTGLVTALHTGVFGTHALDEVAGDNNINPENLLAVVDASTGDPILSSDREVWALLQHESGATDEAAFTDVTPQRAQISFVRVNATHDDIEAVPIADIQDKVINYAFTDRKYLDSWTRMDFLRRSPFVDIGPGAVDVTLDAAIDNQGTTPATQATHVYWRIADTKVLDFQESTGARNLLEIAPNAAGDEVELNVDTLDVNVGASGVVDIDNGVTVDSGGTPINLGVTAGQIDSGAAALKLLSSGSTVTLDGVGVVLDGNAGNVTADGVALDADFTDASHLIQAANAAGAKELLIASRNSGLGAGNLKLEADDDVSFETAQQTTAIPLDDATAGAISALTGGPHASISAAIKYAIDNGGSGLDDVFLFVAAGNYAQGANVPAATFNQTGYTLAMATGVAGADMFVFLNGRLLRGAAAAGTGDVYPGTTPASGDLKFDFPKGIKTNDVILSVGFA
jgi:hypothetical protein